MAVRLHSTGSAIRHSGNHSGVFVLDHNGISPQLIHQNPRGEILGPANRNINAPSL
jgi:hypothetical protein